MATEYQPLVEYVAAQTEQALTLSFAEIEEILGRPLSVSAQVSQSVWRGAAYRYVLAWQEVPVQRRRVDVAHVLILGDTQEHVLLVRDNGHWSLPGRARESGEMLEQAAVREVEGETGLDVAIGGSSMSPSDSSARITRSS